MRPPILRCARVQVGLPGLHLRRRRRHAPRHGRRGRPTQPSCLRTFGARAPQRERRCKHADRREPMTRGRCVSGATRQSQRRNAPVGAGGALTRSVRGRTNVLRAEEHRGGGYRLNEGAPVRGRRCAPPGSAERRVREVAPVATWQPRGLRLCTRTQAHASARLRFRAHACACACACGRMHT
jgi:hypothetical protein